MKADISLKLEEYIDAYVFLRDVYRVRKEKEPDFSFRIWALELGLASKSHLSDVVAGKHELSEEIAIRIASSLKMTENELEHFLVVVAYTNAKTDEAKKALGRRIVQLMRQSEYSALTKEVQPQFEISPLVLAVRNLISFEDLEPDMDAIAFLTGATREDIATILEQLAAQGLVEFDGARARWKAVSEFVRFPDTPKNPNLEHYHRHSLRRAEEAMELAFDERRFRSLQLPMSDQEFQKFQEELNRFAATLYSAFHRSTIQDRRIYQINVQAFPLTKKVLPTEKVASL